MSLPSYQDLKKTDVPWLTAVPQHWELIKFRFLFTFGRGLGITKKDLLDEGIPCISYGEIHSKYSFEVSPEKHELKCVPDTYMETDLRSLLNEGDFVFADTSEDIEGSGNFSYLNSTTPTFAGYHTVITRLQTEDHPRYLAYLFDSLPYRHQIRTGVSGVKVFSVTQDILKNCNVWLPPVEEQEQISKFLDYKTQQIDQLIEKKKSLIEKLNEQRIAVITQAVTKGLDKNAKMKPSGVDWLGDVPDHWDVMSIKFSLDVPITDGPHETPEFLNEGIPFISAEAVKNDSLDFDKKRGFISIEDHERYSKKYKPKRGDVYMVKSGATTGNVARVETDEEFNIWSPLAVFRPNSERSTTDFIFYFTKSKPFFTSVELSWSYGTQQNIGMGVISNLKIAIPPVPEQKEITEHVEREVAHINGMIGKAHEVIIRLQEYRAALITDAVTGKIDVRNVEIGEVA